LVVAFDDGRRLQFSQDDLEPILMPDIPVDVALMGVRISKYFKKYRAMYDGTVTKYE